MLRNFSKAKAAFLSIALCLVLFTVVYAVAAAGKSGRATTTYYFHGSTVSQATDASQWSTSNGDLECGTGTDLPCQVTLNSDDFSSINQYLSGKSAQDIMNDPAVSKRAE